MPGDLARFAGDVDPGERALVADTRERAVDGFAALEDGRFGSLRFYTQSAFL